MRKQQTGALMLLNLRVSEPVFVVVAVSEQP